MGKTQRPYDTPVMWKKYQEAHLRFIDPSTDHLQTAGEVKKIQEKGGFGTLNPRKASTKRTGNLNRTVDCRFRDVIYIYTVYITGNSGRLSLTKMILLLFGSPT